MNRESAESNRAGIVRAATSRVVAITVLIVALVHSRPVHADNIDTLIRDLDSDSDRVRISAVLSLTKQADPRAIPGLANRLANDSDKKIRSQAAKALGAIVTAKVKGTARQQAIDALTRAKDVDPDPFVQVNAERSLTTIGASAPAPPPSGGGGGIYVNIGPMSSKTGTPNDAKFRAAMVSTATTTLARSAPNMPTTWPGGGTPTKNDLAKKGVSGFYVDGTLNSATVVISGRTAQVSCKVSMLLASFPDKSVFGFLNGNAGVQGSSSPTDIALAQQDCVQAVVEDLIAKKIVPTIKSKVP